MWRIYIHESLDPGMKGCCLMEMKMKEASGLYPFTG
jgi:hypothetical protein